MSTPWWQTESLVPHASSLTLDGHDLAALASANGTALYVYSTRFALMRARMVQDAIRAAGCTPAVQYAMKSNRHPAMLRALSAAGHGVDCCSPRELAWALQHGFTAERTSFNAGMLSNRDMDMVVSQGVHCILDSESSLRRYGERVPRGTRVGLRFDPGIKAGYGDDRLAYGRAKFGFEPENAARALEAAERAGLVVDEVHTHIGWGIMQAAEERVNRAFETLAGVARMVSGLQRVNVGGGLGARYRATDQPLSLESWSAAIRRHLQPLGVTVACEPGTIISAQAGVLVVEVNTVETRRGTTWVGVNAGHALNPCVALYGIPHEVVLLRDPLGEPSTRVTVAGHINEATDLWAMDRELPAVREGDLLAILPAGAYGASMKSDHCLRGDVVEIALDPDGNIVRG